MVLLPAIALATLLIPDLPRGRTVPRPGPLLSAALASHPAQLRPPNRIRASHVQTAPRIRAALIGAAIGAAAGGAIGYAWTRDCRCDDPGYGLLVGLPIGTLAGAVFGAVVGGK